MSWPSGHLGHLETVQGSTDTSRMTLWHAGTLLAHLAHWHSRQTHGTGKQTNDESPLSQSGDSDWHTHDVVSRLDDGDVYGDVKLM